MSNIGGRLLEERKRLGLTQVDFSSMGDISKFTLLNYEKGSRYPTADFLALIDKGGVDVLYVITGTRTPIADDQLTSAEARLVEQFRTLSPLRQTAVGEIVELLADREDSEQTEVVA